MPRPRTGSTRGALSVTAAAIVLLAVEYVGLRSGTVGIVLLGFVGVLALVAILTRVDLAVAGVACACLATFTLCWNGWYVGPLRPGDALVFVALGLLIAASPNRALRTPPWWIKQLVLAIALIVTVHLVYPPDALFLAGRTVLTAEGAPTESTTNNLSLVNIGVAFKFVVAVAVLAMALTAAVRADRRAARWLPAAFAMGSALSGWVALSDRFGTSFSALLTGIPNPGGTRQIGLSDHPNFLAPGLVLAFPFAFWLVVGTNRRNRLVGLACLPGIIGGVYASGSRGGAVALVLVIVLSVAIHPRTRIYLGNVLAGLVALLGVTFAAFPSTLDAILIATRLDNPASTTGSDQVRTLLGAQGIRDFLHEPFAGIGLQVSDEAQQVYIQELASGGLILFLAMSIYMLGGIVTSFRLVDRVPYAGAVLAALLATIALNFAEANLTDRYYYLPAALLVALLERRRLDASDTGEPDAAPDAVPGAVEPTLPQDPLVTVTDR